MKIRVVLLVLALMGLGAPAAAHDVGLYIAGYVGQVSKDSDQTDFGAFATEIQTFAGFTPTSDHRSFDDAALTYAVAVGYRFTRRLAFEGAYMRLGQVTHRSRATGNHLMDAGTLDSTIENETSGFTVAAVGFLPLNRDWEVFGRAGALFANNQLSLSIRARGETFVPFFGERIESSFSESSTDYFAGIGVSRRVFEIYSVGLQYQRFFDVGQPDTGGIGDLDTVLLGLSATF